MAKIPNVGYWHCQILTDKNRWGIESLDMSFERLNTEIVKPYRRNKEFVISGTRIKSRDEITHIKIVHSEQKSNVYGKESLSSAGVVVLAPDRILVFDKGNDFTNYLLYSDEYDKDFIELEKKQSQPKNIITINNQQTQSQSQSQNLSISNIIELQDIFAKFRKECKTIEGIDDNDLKEVEDSLDELSAESTPEQKNKAFNKLRRTIQSIICTISNSGDKAIKLVGTLEALKKIYNTCATFINLPLI